MRLTPAEVDNIIQALQPFLMGSCSELRLHGSRVDDTKKGGDIDLLLLADTPQKSRELSLNKHVILAAIKKLIGDQKIDLLMTEMSQLEKDPFLRIIFPGSILLHRWG